MQILDNTVDAVYENFSGKWPGTALRPGAARPCRILWSGTSGGNSSRNRSQRWRTKSEKKNSSTGRWS